MTDSVEGLKQRVVGAVVILSMAVIFLPMIFDKPHETESTTIVPIPPKPEFKTVTVTKASKPQMDSLVVDDKSNKVVLKKPVPVENTAEVSGDNVAKESREVVAKPAVTESKNPPTVAETKPSPPVSVKSSSAGTVAKLPIFQNVWMVQLGTFSNKTNAYRLRDQLRKDGFDSHTKPITIKGKPSIRVFSGPYVSKREAQKRKQKLDAKYGVKSLVLFFDA